MQKLTSLRSLLSVQSQNYQVTLFSPRTYASQAIGLAQAQQYNMPGLYHLEGFMAKAQRERHIQLVSECRQLIHQQLALLPPQLKFHSLTARSSNEVALELPDAKGEIRHITAQVFAGYGQAEQDSEHELISFPFGVPPFVEDIAMQISTHYLNASVRLFKPAMAAINTYDVKTKPEASGFAWHRDILRFGKITAIYNLYGQATMELIQLKPEFVTKLNDGFQGDLQALGLSTEDLQKHTVRLSLTPGSLTLLTGVARYEALHRVLPMEVGERRQSLVIGMS